MTEEFISEAIHPVVEPGLPRQFRWRSEIVSIARVLGTWRETGPCHHGNSDRYVRKHWFEVLTDSGVKMKIYFERQPRSTKQKMERWWLFSSETLERQEADSGDIQ